MSSIADPTQAEAVAQLRAAAHRLLAVDLTPAHADDAYALVREVEGCARVVAAAQAAVLGAVERSGLHQADGHASAAVMVRHAANLSTAEGTRRGRAHRALRDLPALQAAFAAGRIGLPQLDRVARLHGNARIRDALVAVERHVAELAARLPYPELDARLAEWERLTDEDGARDRGERAHRNRDYALRPNLDGTFRHAGGCGGLQGVEMTSILDRFVEAEFAADWAAAREAHGSEATIEHLARTEAQRRADAVCAIFRSAARAHAAQPGGSVIVTNLVIDQETFERLLRQFCGQEVEPDRRHARFFPDLLDDLGRADRSVRPRPGRSPHRSASLDGHPLEPTEVASLALLGHVRRAVVAPDGVTIDLGRTRRLFTGGAQLAARLGRTTCYWPGCQVPVTSCQTDHLTGYGGERAGPTDPRNGAPLCGRHNRHKEHGFTVLRDATGELHVHRPDGTEIPRRPEAA